MNKTAVEKKITKAVAFTAVAEYLNTLSADTVLKTVTVGSGDKAQQVEVTVGIVAEKLMHEVDLLAKKNSAEKKLTEKQMANEAIKKSILGSIDPDRKYTITDLIKEVDACSDLTNQKLSAIVRQMVNDDRTMVRTEEKGKAYFGLALDDEDDEE